MSVGIFDTDLAQEIRAIFQRGLAEGLSVYMVSDTILKEYAEADSVTVYLALAALQAEQQVVQPKVKKKALTIIVTGEGAEAWEIAGPAEYEKRKQVLQELRMKLLAVPT